MINALVFVLCMLCIIFFFVALYNNKKDDKRAKSAKLGMLIATAIAFLALL